MALAMPISGISVTGWISLPPLAIAFWYVSLMSGTVILNQTVLRVSALGANKWYW
ncbi:hypothetical protein D3C72_2549250 [compost metagenome]